MKNKDIVVFTRENLYKELWEISASGLAKKYDISTARLKKVCLEYDIPMPTNMYWTQKRKGIATEKTPLPKGENTEITVEKVKHHERKKESLITAKANTICLLEILKRYSDADNILTMKEIRQKMKKIYELDIDRRTIYSSVIILRELGYEISDYEENGIGYYLEEREFEPSEIRLLMDSVYSNPSVPPRQTEQLIKKIQEFLPEYKQKNYKNLTVVRTARKTPNKEMFYNIEILDNAISKKKMVEFTYMQYTVKKTLEPRRTRKYKVSPYAMVATNEAYYLLCANAGYNDIYHYRIDKIKNISLCDDDIIPPSKEFDIAKHTDESVLMYGGTFITAELKCDNVMIGDIIDEFGQNVMMRDNGDGKTFTAFVKGSSMGLRFWAMRYLDGVEILAPAELRESVMEIIRKNKYGV